MTAAHLATASGPSPRGQRWQRDIAYLARELRWSGRRLAPGQLAPGRLPLAPPAAWNAAAARLQARVPRLTDGVDGLSSWELAGKYRLGRQVMTLALSSPS